jgi:poly-gamma-glutamate synthesis protein (capsule biosynthesis protein)
VPAILPGSVRAALQLPASLGLAETPDQADLRLEVREAEPLSRAVYALAAPFPTLEDSVSSADLAGAWRGEAGGPFAGQPLLMSATTRQVLSAWWGPPAAGALEEVEPEALLDRAWSTRPSWAVVPFDALEPRWKVLEIDGRSPLRADFDPGSYALSVPLGLAGDPVLVEAVLALYGPGSEAPLLPPADRDPGRLTTLAMTGVTALVRATAFTMEARGLTYPARDIGAWLREADLTHISNEVPFAVNCPPPDPVQEGLRFCSDPRYVALLEDVGTDVVELTGDHFQDWGTEAMYFTLDVYRQHDWPYYGGGENIEDGRKAVVVEHNGNRLGFIGCNGKGRPFAGATASSPGAVVCDFAFMEAEIRRLRGEGVLPIATFQHFEYYTYAALPNQVADFGRLAAAGAVVVSGSQAHHPQAMAFQDGSFIHYGLGNLFFDQLGVAPGTELAFIDRHVFYDGRYLGVELLTIRFEDFARARPMTADERGALLRATFAASGW